VAAAPDEALQFKVGVRFVTVVPGDVYPPGVRGVGIAGTPPDPSFTVK
jgi:hypothetical protein